MIVVSECYWTAAAKHADIVLPITTSFERNDLTMTGDYSNQHIVPMKQAVAPQFEARNDFDVFADLAELLKHGGKEIYTEGKDEMAWLKFSMMPLRKVPVRNASLCQCLMPSGSKIN